LEAKCLKNNREMGEEPVRASFNEAYEDFQKRAEEMLSSHSVGGYKTIRDKLISTTSYGCRPIREPDMIFSRLNTPR
jgi:hypothetical protein